MARLDLSYEECAALRQAAERIPATKRSLALVSALRILGAIMSAVENGRAMLDLPEEEPRTPTDPPS